MSYQIATVIGVVTQDNRRYVKVRSLKSKEQCRLEGVQHEWFINEYTFSSDPEMTMLRLGIDQADYDRLCDELDVK